MLMDLYLSSGKSLDLSRQKLQLLGISSLLIAAKLEEVRPPNLIDLSEICDETFDEAEIAKFELEICSTLKWHLQPITLYTWNKFYFNNLVLLTREDENTTEQYQADTNALSDLVMHSSGCLDFKASHLAASIFYIFLSKHRDADYQTNEELFAKCTGLHSVDLQGERAWLQPYLECQEPVAYCEPETSKHLTDAEFDELLKRHRKSLNFLLKQIKIESQT
jgi:G1/S-specific cyclin-E1